MEKAVQNMPRKEALSLIRQNVKYKPVSEYVPLMSSVGRITACDIVSNYNVPNVKCSRWDGICFRYDHYIECGKDVSSWQCPEDYIFSNTGIGIFREEFDTMVMIEKTVFEGDQITGIEDPELVCGQNIIPVGERIAIGELLIGKREKITPSHLNLLASGGILNVPVLKKPVAAVIPTGNELVSRLAEPAPGETTESNSSSMMAKLSLWGADPLLFPITPDDMNSLKSRLKEASAAADLVIIMGGSGRGQHDLLQASAEASGHLFFSSVEHGPAKRTCFALINQTPVIGLVGPPGGEEMSFDFYVLPAVLACFGKTFKSTRVSAILDEDILPHHRTDFQYSVRVYRADDDKLHASLLPHARIDRSIADHNGYLFVKKQDGGFKKGQSADVELRTGYENV